MASNSAVLSMAARATGNRQLPPSSADASVKPLAVRRVRLLSKRGGKFIVRASLKEKTVAGLTAATLTASMIVFPDVAEAAVTPSLKNFLLSIGAGGIVALAIVGAVIAVANFDPVKRR